MAFKKWVYITSCMWFSPLISLNFIHYSFSLPFVVLQVLDNDIMLKIERKFLLEIPADLSGLLEPVSDPEARLNLLSNNALLFSRFSVTDCIQILVYQLFFSGN